MTLEVPLESGRQSVRARVAWVQRPRSIREFFQVAAELETPANIWGLSSPPEDWTTPVSAAPFPQEVPVTATPLKGSVMDEKTNVSPDPGFDPSSSDSGWESRLSHGDLSLSEETRRAAEEDGQQRVASPATFFERWKEEFERDQNRMRDDFSAEVASRQAEFLSELKGKFEKGFGEARELILEIDQKVRAIRIETEAAVQVSNRIERARLEAEASEKTRKPQASLEAASATAAWNERLDLEMALAQSQWNELLQSSLDSGMQRLAGQLSARSRETLRIAEQKLAERFGELRQPLLEASLEAREALSNVRTGLEQEMARARVSLSEIEHIAGRMREYSAQLEAASHDALNEMHRRLENILEAQTEEMNHRAESLVAGLSQRLSPTVDSLGHQLVERTVAEVESGIAPHLERVPELLRDLAAREVEIEESLRLHRERLRQLSDNNQREVAAQIAGTLSVLRTDFESARQEALMKWNEELNASGIRASHAASESIGQASEWFQQEARSRLQVVVEQTLASAQAGCEEAAAQAANSFAGRLEEKSSKRLAEIERHVDGLASEAAGRVRTRMDEAAEAAASFFGCVIRGISEKEAGQFADISRATIEERTRELDRSADEVFTKLAAKAEESMGHFRARMSEQVETGVAEGRRGLSAEFTAMLSQFSEEREARQREWAQGLERLSEEATRKHQDRLDSACDSWTVSSVRRLNEHGLNAIDSLIRSADQALRDSFSKVFEGLAETLRERTANAAGAGFTPSMSRENAEGSWPSQ